MNYIHLIKVPPL